MKTSNILQQLSDKKLIDIVKNYQKYDYDESIRDESITLLEERGYTMEQLRMRGHLDTSDYDIAVNEFDAFRRNYKIGIFCLIFSVGILSIVSIVMMYMAYQNQCRFYKALKREQDSSFIGDICAVMFYIHLRNKMKDELQGFS